MADQDVISTVAAMLASPPAQAAVFDAPTVQAVLDGMNVRVAAGVPIGSQAFVVGTDVSGNLVGVTVGNDGTAVYGSQPGGGGS